MIFFSRYKVYLFNIFIIFSSLLMAMFSHAEIIQETLEQLKAENVVDTSQILNTNDLYKLKAENTAIYNNKKIVIKVLLIESLELNNIDQYTNYLFNTIQIGHKDYDNGILILYAVKENKTRIEIGRGLEGDIPDIQAGRIIRYRMQPEFQHQNYYQGFSNAQQSLALLSEGFVITDDGLYEIKQLDLAFTALSYIFKFILGMFILWMWYGVFKSSRTMSKRRRILVYISCLLLSSLFIGISFLILLNTSFWALTIFTTITFSLSVNFFGKLYVKNKLSKFILILICISYSLLLLYLIFGTLFNPKTGELYDLTLIFTLALAFTPPILIVIILSYLNFRTVFPNKNNSNKININVDISSKRSYSSGSNYHSSYSSSFSDQSSSHSHDNSFSGGSDSGGDSGGGGSSD